MSCYTLYRMDSKLQIISGRFHGRKLYLPHNARPTQNRARAALFNMLGAGLFNVNDSFTVWDAFAGSGAFGIECLSRYPNANVIFSDIDMESIKTVRKNLSLLNIGTAAVVVHTDACEAAKEYASRSDLIFADPPYDMASTGVMFAKLITEPARTGTFFIWEQESVRPAPVPDGWDIIRDKTYGRARFLIMRRDGK